MEMGVSKNMENTIDNIFKEYKGSVFSFEYDGSIKLVKTYFKPDWVITPDDGIIVKKKDNLTLIITKEQDVSFGDLLNFISVIIKNNIEREEKIKLLAEKRKQLEELFNNTSLEELSKLNFSIKQNDPISDFKIVNDEVVIPDELLESID